MIKKILIIITAITFSVTLFFGNFDFSKQKESDILLRVDKHLLKSVELDKLIHFLKVNNVILNDLKVSDIDIKIKNILIKDIQNNIQLRKFGFNVTTEEIKYKMFSDPVFNSNKVFSFQLYEKFLKQNNLSEAYFQKKFIKKILLNKFKNNISLICRNYKNYKPLLIKNEYYIILDEYVFLNRKKFYNSILKSHLNYLQNIEFSNLSIKSLSDFIKIYNQNIKELYNKNDFLYKIPEYIKVNHIVIDKKSDDYLKLISQGKKVSIKKFAQDIGIKENIILLSKKELDSNFVKFFKKYKNDYILIENKKKLHLFFLRKNVYSIFIDNDVKNKYIKNECKLLILRYNNIIKTKEAYHFFYPLNLKKITAILNPYIYSKKFLIFRFFKLQNRHIVLNKYNYFFYKSLTLNCKENFINDDLLNYFKNINNDKMFFYNLFKIKNNINSYGLIKIKNRINTHVFTKNTIFKKDQKYCIFNYKYYMDNICNYKLFLDKCFR